jgi:hypothetical protein
LQRLTKNGNRFTRVASAEEAVTLMRDLASPVAAFVRERCVIGTDKQIEVQRLYSAYRAWCDENGHVKATKATFGRDLRAAIPSVKRRRLREEADDDRVYVYFGIDLAGGSYIGRALGPLGPDPTGQGADGSGPSGPRKSPMYAAPPGKGPHVARSKSDALDYVGPVVPVPDLGPGPLDEHGAPRVAKPQPNGGEPGLSRRRIQELADWYSDQGHQRHNDGTLDTAGLDAELRLILREEVAFPEHVEIEFERVMQAVFAV